jgi:hypothetical protein
LASISSTYSVLLGSLVSSKLPFHCPLKFWADIQNGKSRLIQKENNRIEIQYLNCKILFFLSIGFKYLLIKRDKKEGISASFFAFDDGIC